MVNDVSLNRQFLETGDTEAFSLIFKKYYPVVYTRVARMMRNHPDPAVDAEDITQETFIQAFEKRHEVREPEKLLGWLLAIATNLTLNELRDAKMRRQAGNSFLESLNSLSISEREALYVTSLSEIAKAIVGISRSQAEETVKRVIKQWKEAAKENPTDPVSAMVNNES